MPGMESAITWIEVMPTLVVDRNSHLWWVTVIETIVAAKVLLSVEILGIIHVRVVVEAIPITEISLATPCATICFLFGSCRFGSHSVTA